ncbi:MAG: hypothetical protein IT561_26305 [Alphaproteobacteria bacterium]|nr:hypothetical protein [Alphaproteobacteria bacterium]
MSDESLIGQEVETVAVFPTQWRIDHVYEGSDGVVYARLRRRGEESSIKTLALRTVMDRKRYTWTGQRPR